MVSSVSQKPTSPTVAVLTAIWQRVLQRPLIGVNHNFFGLGGGIHLADRLFDAIAQECGRELPSSTIYHAPTITQLASLLEQPVLPRFSPFVELKAGSKQPAILIVHGLAGTVPFFELARNMATDDHPVYGIQAKGLDGMEEPLDRVEDMAAFYLRSIRKLQPHGPYILIGYSFGGLVALEMAESMREVGEEVALLALVDAYPDPHYMLSRQRLLLGIQRIGSRISEIRSRSARNALSYIVRGLKHRLHIGEVPENADPPPGTSPRSFEYTTLQIKKKAYLALVRYRPRVYRGKIRFIKSQSDWYFPADPAAVWSRLATEFKFETVPGGHLDMLTSDVKVLADVLSRYIQEALHRGQ